MDANTESSIQMAQMMKKIDFFATEFGQLKQKVFMGEHQAAGLGPEEEVHAMNNYNPRPRNDPYSNTYNPWWRNHPNFSWSNNNQNTGNHWGNNNQNNGHQWGNNNSNQRQINTGAQQNSESQPKRPSIEDMLIRMEQRLDQLQHQ